MKNELRMKKPKFGLLRRKKGRWGENAGCTSGRHVQLSTASAKRGSRGIWLMTRRSEVDGGRKIGWLIFDLTGGGAYIPLSVL